ncbi:MAG: hypothetical protein KC422_09720 [Trueperaceae bacterium]|nr:hypothetical protein [Trueperaceae bacterium]
MILLNLSLLLLTFVSIVVFLISAAWLYDHASNFLKGKDLPEPKSKTPSDWQPLPPPPANQALILKENILVFKPVLHTPEEPLRKAA